MSTSSTGSALRNKWNTYNLRESPYFQNDLQGGADATYPIQLVVGRERDAERMLSVIAGATSSRQTIEGAPGFGKTTLTQWVKARAAEAGYLSRLDPVSAAGADNASTLLIRTLRYIYDAVAALPDRALLGEERVEEARRLLRATLVRDVKVATQVAGFGYDREVTERVEPATFATELMNVPPLIRDLAALTHKHGHRGILVHLNNLENIDTDAALAAGAGALRDLRDVWLTPHLHTIIVGTPDAVRGLVSPFPQVRSVFGIGRSLDPLTHDEFQALLARRYRHLCLDETQPVQAPVAHEAAGTLYRAFRGDIRGTLRALDEAAHELLGYTSPPGASITTAELFTVLAPILRAEADSALTDTLNDHLHSLGTLGDTEFSQKDLVALWGLAQPTVSQHLKELQRLGYVREVGRKGRQVDYGLTGTSRIVLGLTA